MSHFYISPVAESVYYDDENTLLGAENAQDAIVKTNERIDLLATPSPSDFIFEGGVSVNEDSGFFAFQKGISVRANRDVYLDINGSFTVNVDSSVTSGPNSSVSVRSL